MAWTASPIRATPVRTKLWGTRCRTYGQCSTSAVAALPHDRDCFGPAGEGDRQGVEPLKCHPAGRRGWAIGAEHRAHHRPSAIGAYDQIDTAAPKVRRAGAPSMITTLWPWARRPCATARPPTPAPTTTVLNRIGVCHASIVARRRGLARFASSSTLCRVRLVEAET
jgi:hypothetical protein